MRDAWEIDRSEIELTGVLGQGQYGEVYKGMWKGSVEVAVKTMKDDTSTYVFVLKYLPPNLIFFYALRSSVAT